MTEGGRGQDQVQVDGENARRARGGKEARFQQIEPKFLPLLNGRAANQNARRARTLLWGT